MIENRTVDLLKNRRMRRAWATLFVVLALVVAGMTAQALTRTGQAATDTAPKATALAETHEHSDACYNEAGELACGYDEAGEPLADTGDAELTVGEDEEGDPALDGAESFATTSAAGGEDDENDEGEPSESEEPTEENLIASQDDALEIPAEDEEQPLDQQAAPMALAATASDTASREAFQNYLNSLEGEAANEWQIVDGRYAGNDAEDKQASDGNVRLQKNVVPAGIENEFFVYLSVDVQEQYAKYFEKATYQATTSNNFHDRDLGTVVTYMTGNEKVSVTGEQQKGWNSAYFTISTQDGTTLAKKVRLYWSQANNVTFYLKTSDGHYILVGLEVKKGGEQNVVLSTEAYDLIREDMLKQAVALKSVSDTMGDYVVFEGVVGGYPEPQVTSYDEKTRTLTWTPTCDGSDLSEEKSGSTTTVWYNNVAQLVYKVRLDVTKDGFSSCAGNMASKVGDNESYAVNQSATLTYNNGETAAFPVPYVRGLLYTVEAQKTDGDGQPLAGATFGLFAGSEQLATAMSDDSGALKFDKAVPWGTYTLQELSAPSGYQQSHASTDVTLCYTTSPDTLEPAGSLMKPLASQTPTFENRKIPAKPVLLKKLAEGSANALAGATFTLQVQQDGQLGSYVDAEGALQDAPCSFTTDGTGVIFKGSLENGTYVLTETSAPDGYNKLASPLVLTVSDDGVSVDDPNASDQAAGTSLAPDAEGFYTYSIANSMGTVMPETGGAGTQALQLAGALLLAMCLSVGLVRYRTGERRAAH